MGDPEHAQLLDAARNARQRPGVPRLFQSFLAKAKIPAQLAPVQCGRTSQRSAHTVAGRVEWSDERDNGSMKVRDPDGQHGSASPSIIDAHHHFWDTTRQDYPGMTGELAKLRRAFSPSDLQPHLVETGVVGTIVVETRSDLNETREIPRWRIRSLNFVGVGAATNLWASATSCSTSAMRNG